jgi:hypothetical protein
MRIELFEMERAQCLYEHEVEYNLSESGVSPIAVEELLDGKMPASGLLSQRLGYPWAGGSPQLRRYIADYYGAYPENVRVTNGSSEANFIGFWGLLERGDRAAIMIPNYLQTWGLARHFVQKADPYYLIPDHSAGRWVLDTDSLRRAVRARTKIILVTNPNNPTGAVLTEEEMNEIVRTARKVGAWIIADEVYRGAAVRGDVNPTFWGRYRRLLITSGLSKAFGLPGLRIGWMVGPAKVVEKLEWYHDYLTLTPTMLSERLACIAMEPSRREALLQRTRDIIRKQLPQLGTWIQKHEEILSWIPPQSGAIATVNYRLPISSTKLFERLRKEKSVLISPGAHFGLKGRYLRIGYGYDMERTVAGLQRISEFLATVAR